MTPGRLLIFNPAPDRNKAKVLLYNLLGQEVGAKN
jgi:hypothetical protein